MSMVLSGNTTPNHFQSFESSTLTIFSQVGSPLFKVRRYRPKGQKKLVKKATFECRICHKETLKREVLPTLDTMKTQKNMEFGKVKPVPSNESNQENGKKKKRKKKDPNAGLIIKQQPSTNSFKSSSNSVSSLISSSSKLKSLLKDESLPKSESRLSKMLK